MVTWSRHVTGRALGLYADEAYFLNVAETFVWNVKAVLPNKNGCICSVFSVTRSGSRWRVTLRRNYWAACNRLLAAFAQWHSLNLQPVTRSNDRQQREFAVWEVLKCHHQIVTNKRAAWRQMKKRKVAQWVRTRLKILYLVLSRSVDF